MVTNSLNTASIESTHVSTLPKIMAIYETAVLRFCMVGFLMKHVPKVLAEGAGRKDKSTCAKASVGGAMKKPR